MSEQEIIEGNKLIAEFMELQAIEISAAIYQIKSSTHLFFEEFKINDVSIEQGFDKNNPLNYFHKFLKFRYHSSWDWIYPVVKKINNIRKFEEYGYITQIAFVNLAWARKDINEVWESCVKFIKWYNQINKNE